MIAIEYYSLLFYLLSIFGEMIVYKFFSNKKSFSNRKY